MNNNQTKKENRVFVQPKAYLKGDYLTLRLPGNQLIRKHINYYKAILGLPFTPKAKASK